MAARITNCEVVLVFPDGWGSYVGQMNTFVDYIMSSDAVFDILAEYSTPSYPINKGSRVATVTVPSVTITRTNAESIVTGLILDNTVPYKYLQTLYIIFLSPGQYLGTTGPEAGYCAVHSYSMPGLVQAPPLRGYPYIWAMIPHPSQTTFNGLSCYWGGTEFDSLTVSVFHEIAEAICSPFCDAFEVIDTCNNSVVRLGGYLIQQTYSQNAGACIGYAGASSSDPNSPDDDEHPMPTPPDVECFAAVGNNVEFVTQSDVILIAESPAVTATLTVALLPVCTVNMIDGSQCHV